MSGVSPPRILLLADRGGEELAALCGRHPMALLTVATRPLLDLCLDDVLKLRPKQLDIIISAHSEDLRRHLDAGAARELDLTVHLSRGDETPAAVLRRAGVDISQDLLVLRADMFRVGPLEAFVQAARDQTNDCVAGVIGGTAAGLWYCRGSTGLDKVPGWPLSAPDDSARIIELTGACDPLDSLGAFHRVNLAAVRGRYPTLKLPGRMISERLRLGRGARCAARPPAATTVILGQSAQVLAGVRFGGAVAIGDGVLIDRNSQVEDAVLLPHSYIGADVELCGVIVSGNTLIHADSGSELTVVDAFLLADLKRPELSQRLSGPLHRLAGLLLLLLSAPLWPVAALAALLRDPKNPLPAQELMGNPPAALAGVVHRTPFTARQWNTRIPVLRGLPLILSLLSGRLRLLGPSPLPVAEAEARDQDWQHVPDEAPAGLFGPTQLLLRPEDPLEERLLSDAFCVRQRSLRGDLMLLLRAAASLFGARAWRPAAPS